MNDEDSAFDLIEITRTQATVSLIRQLLVGLAYNERLTKDEHATVEVATARFTVISDRLGDTMGDFFPKTGLRPPNG